MRSTGVYVWGVCVRREKLGDIPSIRVGFLFNFNMYISTIARFTITIQYI